MSVRFVAAAEQELTEAEDWYAGQEERLAARFMDEVERGLVLISERPTAWRSLDGGVRQFLLWRFPYSIIYRITPEAILILAVAHLRRKPDYWRDRL